MPFGRATAAKQAGFTLVELVAVVVLLVQYAYRTAGESAPTFRAAADALVEFRDLDVDAPPIEPGPPRG